VSAQKPGETIGTYANCRIVAEGVTSTIYVTSNPSSTTSSSKEASEPALLALKCIHEARPPHNWHLEVAILKTVAHANIIPLLASTRTASGEPLLIFPYQPLDLAALLSRGATLPPSTVQSLTSDLLSGLVYLHKAGIIHRDIKPSNLLLSSTSPPHTPLQICDFGTAWHPQFSPKANPPEPADRKEVEIGTGPYRAPEALFAHKPYSTPLDIWAAGCLIVELLRTGSTAPGQLAEDGTPKPLFESRSADEDGNQLVQDAGDADGEQLA
jgi:serine/threonine protein kinase